MSWIILSKETNKAVFETFDELKVEYLNKDKYYAMTAYDYLCRLNKEINKNALL